MPAKVLFVRHGQSQANADKVIATVDSPLSQLGREQAHATGRRLQSAGVTKIMCSPFARARQTAEIIAQEVGYDSTTIEIVNELHERRFGEKEGGPKDHESAWYYTVDDEYGIESHAAVIARMQRCAEKLRVAAAEANGTVVIVGHATAGYYLRQVLKGKVTFATFDPPDELMNAEVAELTL